MNYIFYLHSNICVISVFKTIENLIEKNEDVVIVSERGTKFPIKSDKIRIYNVQEILDGNIKKTSNPFTKIWNYKFRVYKECRKFAMTIINKRAFVIYTPSYNMYSVRPFLESEFCNGYYFIEEGTLSYLTSNSLHTKYIERRYKQGRFFLDLLGMGEVPDYYVTNKFKGCLCLSDYAFPWCNNKQVTDIGSYYANMNYEELEANNIIVSDWLRNDIGVLEDAFNTVVERLIKNGNEKIAIKFHPQAYAYEKEKISAILSTVKKKYKTIETVLLPAEYPLELLMYHKTMNVYSIFGHSSVLLYALILKSNVFVVNHIGRQTDIREVATIHQFIRDINLKYARY